MAKTPHNKPPSILLWLTVDDMNGDRYEVTFRPNPREKGGRTIYRVQVRSAVNGHIQKTLNEFLARHGDDKGYISKQKFKQFKREQEKAEVVFRRGKT